MRIVLAYCCEIIGASALSIQPNAESFKEKWIVDKIYGPCLERIERFGVPLDNSSHMWDNIPEIA